jgi:hypothetical protein
VNEARVWIRNNDNERAEACLRAGLLLIPDNQTALRLLEKIAPPAGEAPDAPKADSPNE